MKKKTVVHRVLKELAASYEAVSAKTPLRALERFEPASVEERAELARIAGTRLPAMLLSYLKRIDRSFPLMGGYDLLSPSQIVSRARDLKEMLDDGTFAPHLAKITGWADGRWDDDRFAHCYWNRAWIPIAEDACGNALCVDLDPGPEGEGEQIIAMEFQDGQGPYLHDITDLIALLGVHVEAIKDGGYAVEADPYGDFLTVDGDVPSRVMDVWIRRALAHFWR